MDDSPDEVVGTVKHLLPVAASIQDEEHEDLILHRMVDTSLFEHSLDAPTPMIADFKRSEDLKLITHRGPSGILAPWWMNILAFGQDQTGKLPPATPKSKSQVPP